MRVLVACEYSGTVRDAFLSRGHDAMSCDLLPTDAPGPHYQGDVCDVLRDGWDLMIAHPPCTYLTIAAEWAYKDAQSKRIKPGTLIGAARRQARDEAIAFVALLANADIPRIAIENPVGVLSSHWRKPDQIIQPWQYGHDASKATCLWLKGLPPLLPTREVQPRYVCCGAPLDVEAVGMRGCANCCGDKRVRPRWGNQTDSGQNKLPPTADRWKLRSTTYTGIAEAMAEQWGGQQRDDNEGICGLCGLPGADKIPHPINWPNERVPDTDLVHADCEADECARASAMCQGKARDEFLRNCC